MQSLRRGNRTGKKSSKHAGLHYSLPDPLACQERARFVLDRIRVQANRFEPDKKLAYVLGELRRVNPFVLEDLYLHCFEECGCQVERPTYTNDGGIDGAFWVEKDFFLVQSKRYKDFIEPEHIGDFDAVIKEHPYALGGFFFHTGRTNIESHYYLEKAKDRIIFMSGSRLVDFVLNGLQITN